MTAFSFNSDGLSTQLSGFAYAIAANPAYPTDGSMTGPAVKDIMDAYNGAALVSPTNLNYGGDSIAGLTFVWGVYR